MNVRRGILTNSTIKPVETVKERNTRTHSERLAALRVEFEKCKARAEATGSINECSVEKVTIQANVSDTYLYKNKLKELNQLLLIINHPALSFHVFLHLNKKEQIQDIFLYLKPNQ